MTSITFTHSALSELQRHFRSLSSIIKKRVCWDHALLDQHSTGIANQKNTDKHLSILFDIYITCEFIRSSCCQSNNFSQASGLE